LSAAAAKYYQEDLQVHSRRYQHGDKVFRVSLRDFCEEYGKQSGAHIEDQEFIKNVWIKWIYANGITF